MKKNEGDVGEGEEMDKYEVEGNVIWVMGRDQRREADEDSDEEGEEEEHTEAEQSLQRRGGRARVLLLSCITKFSLVCPRSRLASAEQLRS